MKFRFVSEWYLAAPPTAVWPLLQAPEEWPRWWPEIRRVVQLKAGRNDGEGAVCRTWWSSRMRDGLVIDFTTRVSEKMRLLVLEARGDLFGLGWWELTVIPVGTRVRYTWQVSPHKPWMKWLAPILFPLFAWNHHMVMKDGASGMARRLGVELIDYHRLRGSVTWA